MPRLGAAPGVPPHALPTGGCCSPLRPSRGNAGAFSMCMAHAAPGARLFPSVGSGAACRLAPRPVAHPPTRQVAGSLGLAGRGVRRPLYTRPGRSRPGLFALAIAACITSSSSRGVCPAAPSRVAGSVALRPPAGGIYYGAPSGGTLGFVVLWPFRPSPPHARACLVSSPRVRIAPPAPRPGGPAHGLRPSAAGAPHK